MYFWNKLWNSVVWVFVFFQLPSASPIKQEWFAVLFLKDSTKLRSDIPSSQADGWASLCIFPPHVTLRLGILQQNKANYHFESKQKNVLR